jgi:hypothetical protein
MSLTFKTTCPIFLILIGDSWSVMVAPPYDKKADGLSTEQPVNAGTDSRLSIMETSSRQNVQDF